MGIDGYDLKEACNLCGKPVCLYYINYEEGLKMCSNEDCTYPFSGERMEFYNIEEFKAKLSAGTAQFDPTGMKAFKSNQCRNKLTDCITNVTASQKTQKEDKSSTGTVRSSNSYPVRRSYHSANLEKSPKKKVELLKSVSIDDDEHLIDVMKRVNDAHPIQPKRSGIIKNPKMLQQLKQFNRLKQMRSFRPHPEPEETPQYEVKIDTNSEGGPIIKIDLTSYSQMQLTCTNDGASTSSQVFL